MHDFKTSSDFIFIFSHLEWICCNGTKVECMYVCVCVCVCVYVCDSATAQTDGWTLMKFSTNYLTDICEVQFSWILTFQNPRKANLANICQIICKKFHQNPSIRLGCSAVTHTYTHTRTQTYTHPRFHRNIFSQNYWL